jgi:hypothetical protein
MPARTYSTDVYLICPCRDCEGRKVRITLSKFRRLSRPRRQPASKSCTSWCPDATTSSCEAKPSGSNRSAKHPAGASAANDSGGVSAIAMGRLDRRWKAAAADVQMVAASWVSREPPMGAVCVRRRTAQRSRRTCPRHSAVRFAIEPRSPVGRRQSPDRSRVRQRPHPSELPRRTTRRRKLGGRNRGPSRRLARSTVRAGTARTAPPHPPSLAQRHGQTAQSLVGGHLVGMKHPAERQLHCFADACVMGNLHHYGSPVRYGHTWSGSRLTRRRHQAEAPTPVVRVAAAIAGARGAAAPRD